MVPWSSLKNNEVPLYACMYASSPIVSFHLAWRLIPPIHVTCILATYKKKMTLQAKSSAD